MINKKYFAEQQLAVGEGFDDIVQSYISALIVAINTIKQAWQKGDLQQLSDITHKIKGSSGSMGAEVLFALLGEIEKQAKLGVNADADMIQKLEHTAELTMKELSVRCEKCRVVE